MNNQKIETHNSSIWILLFWLIILETLFFSSYFGIQTAISLLLGIPFKFSFGVFIFLHLIEVCALVYISLLWSSETVSISEKDISIKKGILITKQDVYKTKNIESVKVRQSFLGFIFGFGTLTLYAPTIKETIILKHLKKPHKIADKIKVSMQKSGDKIIPVA